MEEGRPRGHHRRQRKVVVKPEIGGASEAEYATGREVAETGHSKIWRRYRPGAGGRGKALVLGRGGDWGA